MRDGWNEEFREARERACKWLPVSRRTCEDQCTVDAQDSLLGAPARKRPSEPSLARNCRERISPAGVSSADELM